MSELGSNSKTISGSQLLETGNGVFEGFIVNSHSSGKLKMWDNTTASGRVLMNTFTFPSGSSMQKCPDPMTFRTGLFATVEGTDVSVTPVYRLLG